MTYRPATGRMRERDAGESARDRRLEDLTMVDAVSGCLMLVKREVFGAAGLLDEDFFFSFEDLEFCLRARRAGWLTALAGGATAYHEGSRSIGQTSTRRLYFAARNHLLAAHRSAPESGVVASAFRSASIVSLNLMHAMGAPGASAPRRLAAVVRGTLDYASGRFGAAR
jgi:GT2 family glycosyltransferase